MKVALILLTVHGESRWITLSYAHHVLSNTLIFSFIPRPHISYHQIAPIHNTHSVTTQNLSD